MPNTFQDFFAEATQKAAADLETALLRLPDDKRGWRPAENSRSALDQVAECAILNSGVADLIQSRVMPDFDFAAYERAKQELARDEGAARSLLQENTQKVIAAIRAVLEEDLDVKVQLPWGPMTLADLVAHSYGNMRYHEGQINYIASLLGCLE